MSITVAQAVVKAGVSSQKLVDDADDDPEACVLCLLATVLGEQVC